MKSLFDETSFQCAVKTTKNYSTSFSSSVSLLDESIRQAVYNVYGFVRVADEIVDSFDGFPKAELLDRFEDEYHHALEAGISTNPIINAFVITLKQYDIDLALVKAFLKSMRADLNKEVYETKEEIAEYIYGSADVVGLICLKIFVNGNEQEYQELKPTAKKLGSAFQKINFLRDFKHDFEELNRTYFPGLSTGEIEAKDKKQIVQEIRNEFHEAFQGIIKLPNRARLGVYVAYKYYIALLNKVEKTPTELLKEKRIRVSNYQKAIILSKSYISCKLNLCKP